MCHCILSLLCSLNYYTLVSGASKAYGSHLVFVCVCVCVCVSAERLSAARSPRLLKLCAEMCSANLTQCYLEMKLVVLLCSYGVIYVAHFDGCFFPILSPLKIEEQAAYNGLLYNLKNTICITRQTATLVKS